MRVSHDTGLEIRRGGAPAPVRLGEPAHPDWYFCDEVECGDRRPAVLEELPRLHHVQNAIRGPGRIAAGDRTADPAVRAVLRAGEAAAALAKADDRSVRRRHGAARLAGGRGSAA